MKKKKLIKKKRSFTPNLSQEKLSTKVQQKATKLKETSFKISTLVKQTRMKTLKTRRECWIDIF